MRTTFVASTPNTKSICIFQVGGNFLVSKLSQNLLGVKPHLPNQLWTMALQPGASPLGAWRDGGTVATSLLGCMAGPMDLQHRLLASQVSREDVIIFQTYTNIFCIIAAAHATLDCGHKFCASLDYFRASVELLIFNKIIHTLLYFLYITLFSFLLILFEIQEVPSLNANSDTKRSHRKLPSCRCFENAYSSGKKSL